MNRGVKERKNVSVQANKDKATDERTQKRRAPTKSNDGGDSTSMETKKLVLHDTVLRKK